MANRRKFIAGLGALATGSAAAMGTGAFSFANVERDMSVSVVDDANGFLAIEEGTRNGEYVDVSGNQASLVFDDTSGVNGTGVNEDSDYLFRDVIRVTNQGTQGVGLWFNDFENGNDPSAGTSQDAPVKWYIQRLDDQGNLTGSLEGAGDNRPAPDLDVGETVAVCVSILLRGSDDKYDLPENVRIYADKAGYNGGS